MAEVCCGVVGETETSAIVDATAVRPLRRRRSEIHHQIKFLQSDVAAAVIPPAELSRKRAKLEPAKSDLTPFTTQRVFDKAIQRCMVDKTELTGGSETELLKLSASVSSSSAVPDVVAQESSRFGITSVCGRRRDMEDAVSVHPSFFKQNNERNSGLHFYGVFDGHGCSHVAMKCKERMHEIVKEDLESREATIPWTETMTKSFSRMDKEVTEWTSAESSSNCRCELQTPQCDAVGSTAVVAVVTPEKIVVSNCGDSRAVLCRKGVAIPLSSDHKPDREDELARIENAGGRVIYWDGARVLGMLAMSRAIGDNYLKPYVIPEPEVTVTERTDEDDCLILASDGLWDVVSNETACNVARMCLSAQKPASPPQSPGNDVNISAAGESSDKACSDASILLTKLALARRSADNVSVVVVDLRRNL